MFKMGVGECRRGMAYGAIIGNRNVGRIDLCRCAGCIDTVVAGRAVIDDTGMIEHGRCKGATGDMTDPAILGCRDVVRLRILARCIDTVVAGIAAHGQHGRVAVIDECVGKIACVMTQGTVSRSCRVWRRGRLPSGPEGYKSSAAIMARGTILADAAMVESRGCKSGNRMADVTILAGW